MEGITNTESTPKIQPDVPATTETKGAEDKSSENSFETFLKAKLGSSPANQVSEEALFASLVEERVETLKGAETGKKYSDALELTKSAARKADGFIPLEDAAKSALRQLRDSGSITKDEADQIYSEAFMAAQLDSNTDALYDDRGGANDPTVAVAAFSDALGLCKGKVDQFKAGSLTATVRSLDEAAVGKASGTSSILPVGDIGPLTSGSGEIKNPDGNTFDGQNGFLFKPVSENQGTVAVLLPESMKGNVSGVVLMNLAGEILDDGHSTGYGEEGTREKFSFSKPGDEYAKDLVVKVQFLDGTDMSYAIPDPSQRYD